MLLIQYTRICWKSFAADSRNPLLPNPAISITSLQISRILLAMARAPFSNVMAHRKKGRWNETFHTLF
jgi:hypothetical protein